MPHYHDGNVEEMEDDYDMDEPVEDMDEVENHGPVAIGSDSDEDEDDEYGLAVASVTFDLLFLLVLGSYLIVLFSFLVITTRGLDDLINIFRRPPSRKVKGA